MKSLQHQLATMLAEATGLAPELLAPLPTKDPKFGDYQCNAAMAQAKKQGKPPRGLADEWARAWHERFSQVAHVEVAGPGFLNMKLQDGWVVDQLSAFEPTHWESTQQKRRVVVEYCSPNLAKELHVGHIRSTIQGDFVARVTGFAGHDLVLQNHLGDWGTQFGMLCTYMAEHPEEAARSEGDLASIETLYRKANALKKADPAFAERSREAVVALHTYQPETLALWQQVVELSRQSFAPLYEQLDVLLRPENERAESFYGPELAELVEWFQREYAEVRNGMQVRISDDAVCIFHFKEDGSPMFLNQDGQPHPFMIRKQDGAFLYATTDLAAARYRIQQLEADTIIVLTDSRQSLHFQQLIETVRRAGWLEPAGREPVSFQHVTFGMILGPDGKPLKTRSGENVKLSELLSEAVERSAALVREHSREDMSEDERAAVARAVGVGSLKYSDLAQSRTTDFTFSWEKMISLEGNTASYLMYALARVRSILRKAQQPEAVEAPLVLEHPVERALSLWLLRFPESLELCSREWRANLLTDYLYSLAGAVMRFFEECPVLPAEPELRASRLRLCDRVAATLDQGLRLLGITPVQRM